MTDGNEQTGERKLIQIVTPLYNESENVEELARRLALVFDRYDGIYDFEVIAVENGSADDTYEKLLKVRADDPRFKVIQLTRNYHMEGGMSAGLAHATGDAVVIMASDLQDPPELIHDFIEKWEQGYENIYQIVVSREDNSRFRRAMAQSFYWIIDKLSETPVPRNVSDFRLVDRCVYEPFVELPERNRMFRAMWGFVGGRSIGIEHPRPPRHGGTTKFKAFATAGFALRGILSSSLTPLKVFPVFGLGLSALSFVALTAIVVRALFFGVPFPGFGTIVSLILLLFGFLFLFLGVISEYIGMIFLEARHRPSFVVRSRHGLQRPGGPAVRAPMVRGEASDPDQGSA